MTTSDPFLIRHDQVIENHVAPGPLLQLRADLVYVDGFHDVQARVDRLDQQLDAFPAKTPVIGHDYAYRPIVICAVGRLRRPVPA
jgi:hypothetical protein